MLAVLLALVSQVDLPREVARCAAVPDSLQRLSCFDTLAKAAAPSAPADPAAVPATAGKAAWAVTDEKNPLDDSQLALTGVISEEQNARLAVRCKSGELDVWITWMKYIGREAIHVTLRVDSEKASTATWGGSTDGRAAFARKAPEFAARLQTATRLVAQVTPYSSVPITSTFTLQGGADAIARVRKTCGQ